ncbi:hypothetical protein MtrunA17_Chr5g0402181 [Medicago truncatula]|uniref:Uncharacterized protein n=1 Tax=Medicago truncatula TaxID=3880 RepID=A0A396HNK5_MEDTR|nr:hypothetical protein MtrunA17_Chr5g0402181 [Medicago truncatula]
MASGLAMNNKTFWRTIEINISHLPLKLPSTSPSALLSTNFLCPMFRENKIRIISKK